MPFKTMAHIHSLNGEMREVTVLETKYTRNSTYYIVDYEGILCTAVFNFFVGDYYADDVYGRL